MVHLVFARYDNKGNVETRLVFIGCEQAAINVAGHIEHFTKFGYEFTTKGTGLYVYRGIQPGRIEPIALTFNIEKPDESLAYARVWCGEWSNKDFRKPIAKRAANKPAA